MRCIISSSNNPYVNLATEEFFLKNSNEEFFLLYINTPCIIVGKHQNLLAEINNRFVYNNSITLARRISGGGTVYQDLNNLNFSFIHNCSNLDQMNFSRFTYPILNALLELGLNSEFSGRNDLLIDSKKVSGNAMHIYKNRVLSHGTLLFKSDLEQLSLALNTKPQKFVDKSIKSVRSKVTNISNYLGNPLTMDQFKEKLFNNIFYNSPSSYSKPIDDYELKSIIKISKEKFETWDWIFGYSPKYEFHNYFTTTSGEIYTFDLYVEKGIIKGYHFNQNHQKDNNYLYALELLINVKHDFNSILEILKNNIIITSDPNFNISEFCWCLF